jgi:hypothetical protein
VSRVLEATVTANATRSNTGFGMNFPIIDLRSLFPYQAFVSWILRYSGQDNWLLERAKGAARISTIRQIPWLLVFAQGVDLPTATWESSCP